MTEALDDHVRPCRSRNELDEAGTSATGARSVSMPAHASATPVAAPCWRAVEALPRAPSWGGDNVGGAHGTRRTEPPSWSVAMSGGG